MRRRPHPLHICMDHRLEEFAEENDKMSVELCPVCLGRGWVRPDFYSALGVSTSTASEQCRACGGEGVFRDSEDLLRQRVEELENELSLYVGCGDTPKAKKSRKVLLKGERRLVSIEARIERLEKVSKETVRTLEQFARQYVEDSNTKSPDSVRAGELEDALSFIFSIIGDIDDHIVEDGPHSGVMVLAITQIMKKIVEVMPQYAYSRPPNDPRRWGVPLVEKKPING